MSTDDTSKLLPAALLKPTAYPHHTGDIRLLETHMSWVFLTGEHVYKVKKPVRFAFADFSSLQQRAFFCAEELRLNRRFAPELYLGVVPIVADGDTGLRIAGPEQRDAAVEWAVHMHQFDSAAQADALLAAGELSVTEMHQFGRTLANQHADVPACTGHYDPVGPMIENFDTLEQTLSARSHSEILGELRTALEVQLAQQQSALLARQHQGHVRECHGDLHLSNMVRLAGNLAAFDCLEFDPGLRMIDTACDTAFLLMDCMVRGRDELGYAFIDGYLDTSGDYEGAALLPVYAVYRSMVRAKVAALRADQAPEDQQARDNLHRHLHWAAARVRRGIGRLIIMHGVSGTGKSYWAAQLAPGMGALRLRSDVLRKVSNGVHASEHAAVGIEQGLYASGTSDAVYRRLADLIQPLLSSGENVIVDAACLQRSQRDLLYAAAHSVGARTTLFALQAPRSELERRITHRNRQGDDPSDADIEVLRWQLQNYQPPDRTEEPVVEVDSTDCSVQWLLQHQASPDP